MKEKCFFSEEMKREIKKIIEENRSLGGSLWKDYTQDELLEVYDGTLPYWAAR